MQPRRLHKERVDQEVVRERYKLTKDVKLPDEPEIIYLASGKVTDVDEEESTVVGVINTADIDSYDEIVLPKGGNFERYLKNPVVMWAHSYEIPPIGTNMWLKGGRKRITAKTVFDTVRDFPEEVFGLYVRSVIKGWSIGFLSIESHKPDEKELEKNDWPSTLWRVYDKWELLEYSAVPIPSNPAALSKVVEKGVSVEIEEAVSNEDWPEYFLSQFVESEGEDKVLDVEEGDKEEVKEVAKVPKRVRKILIPKTPIVRRFLGVDEAFVARAVKEELFRLRGKI